MASESLLLDEASPFSQLLTPARYKCFWGGRGSAKSWTVAEALVLIADSCSVRVLCAREFQNSIADSVHRLLCDQIERLGLAHRFTVTDKSILHKATGSEFIFKGLHRNIREIKSLEGIDIAWVEEAQSVTKNSWEILIPTIRKEGSEIWATFNPDEEDDPTYQRFVVHTPPDAIVHKVNFSDNPYFPDVLERERQYYLELIETAPDDAAREQAQADYDHVWEGMTRRRIGSAIIKRWRIADFDIPKDVRWLHGADWGFANDPTALIRFCVHNQRLYIDSEAFGHGVEIDDTPALFDSIDTARDWPIKADSARPETISYMKRQGFNISAADKWPGSVEDGIAHLNGFKEIIIRPRCKHIAREARLYSYKVDKVTGEILPIIVDAHNHGWDAVRYGLDKYIKGKGRPMRVSKQTLNKAGR